MDLSRIHQIVLESVSEAVYVRDLDMNILYINPASEQLTGWSLEEAKRKKCYEVFGDEQARCKGVCLAEKVIAGGVHILHREGSLKSKSGEIREVQVSISPIHEAGEVAGTVVVLEDITGLEVVEKTTVKALATLEKEIEARKRAEEKLKESDSQKQAILDGITTNLAFVNEHLEILWANKAAADSVQKSSFEMIGHRCHELWADPAKPCDDCPTVKTFQTKRSEQTTIFTPDGRVWDEKGEPVFDVHGRLVGVVEIAHDITERKRAEEELAKSEALLKAVLDASPVGIALVRNRNLEWANRTLYDLFGYQPDEIQEKGVRQFYLSDDDYQRVGDTLYNGLAQGEVREIEMSYKRRDGTSFPCLLRATMIDDPGSLTVITAFLDITERKRAEDALRESEQKYRRIVENTQDIIYQTDMDGRLIFASLSSERVLGYTPEEFMGRRPSELYRFPEERTRLLKMLMENGSVTGFEAELTSKDGRRVWASANARLLRDEMGKPVGVEGVVRDITASKIAEDALRVSEQKYRALSENVPCVVYSLPSDEHSTNLLVSGRIEELTGYSVDEFLEDSALYPRLVHPDDRARVQAEIEGNRRQKSVLDVEYRIVTKAGAVKWIRDRANPTLDEYGEIANISGFLEDITDRKRAEQELLKERDFSTFILESLPGTFYLFDTHGRIMRWNTFLEHVSGYSSEEMASMHVLDFFPEDEKPKLQEAVNEVFTRGETYLEADWMTRRGERIPYYFSSKRVYVEDQPCLIGVGIDITDRKRMERALEESEEKYRNIFDNAVEGIFQTSPEGRLITANPAFARMFGYDTPEEIIKDVTDIASKLYANREDRQRFKDRLRDSDPQDNYEMEWCRRDGTALWVSVNARAIRDATGNVLFYEGTCEDITSRRQTEQALRRSESLLKEAQRVAHIGHWEMAAPTGTLTLSEEIFRILGIDPASGGHSVDAYRDLVHPDDRPMLNDAVRNGTSQGIPFDIEFRLILPDQSIRWMNAKGNPTGKRDGDFFAMFGTAQDITERKLAQEALQESEARYRVLFNDSKDGVYITKRDGELIEANQAYFDLLGYTREEAIGGDIHTIYVNPSDRDRFVEEIETRGFLRDYPLTFKRKDGKEMECLLTSSLRRAADGAILGYHGIIRDVTEQRNLQKQLLQAQKMEAVGTLAGGIAHDFNNLLTVITGFSELLLLARGHDHADYADLQKILHAARNGADVVQRLLTFSRKSEPKLVRMNLNKQIVQVEKLLRHAIPRMIDIHLDLSPDLPEINADPSQIEQVVMNLAVNARDAMPDVGKLTVRTSIVTLDDEYCRFHIEANPGEYVALEVSDTGHGMDKETVEHIFEPFFTTKEMGRGTGLGLAIVYGLVKQHNGHVSVYSEVGRGTAFRVYLPAIPADVETKAVDRAIIPAFGTETILLVDDEESIRELGARILTKHGYKVVQARNGMEALDIFKKKRSQIALVVLDLIMPKMGGRECLKELLKIDPQVSVLVASGFPADASVKEPIQMGAKGFVSKPFRVKEFLRDIRKVLDKDD